MIGIRSIQQAVERSIERFAAYSQPAYVGIVWSHEAETRWREAKTMGPGSPPPQAPEAGATAPSGASPPLLEKLLPDFEARVVRETAVDAPPDVTYAAIADTNLLDPIVLFLFGVRELPARLLARFRGKPRPSTPRSITMQDFLAPGTGMVRLVENPGIEIVVGSVGRIWEPDYGHRAIAPGEFAVFREPGHAKLAMDFWVRPDGRGGSVLRYEARTTTTDENASRRFGRYWRVIRPGVWLVMGRAVSLVRREAERRAKRCGV